MTQGVVISFFIKLNRPKINLLIETSTFSRRSKWVEVDCFVDVWLFTEKVNGEWGLDPPLLIHSSDKLCCISSFLFTCIPYKSKYLIQFLDLTR